MTSSEDPPTRVGHTEFFRRDTFSGRANSCRPPSSSGETHLGDAPTRVGHRDFNHFPNSFIHIICPPGIHPDPIYVHTCVELYLICHVLHKMMTRYILSHTSDKKVAKIRVCKSINRRAKSIIQTAQQRQLRYSL